MRTIVGRLFLAALLLTGGVMSGSPAASAASEPAAIVVASTTSVENSGLLARLLPVFTRETGIAVKVVAQGTGQALETAARGDADLVLVHDPDAEARFVGAGHGLPPRQIAWNDFVIVGPDADPARIDGGHDAVVAFKAIAAAAAPFVSRGDKSGTDALEKRLWSRAGLDPAALGGGRWYRDIGGGMGAALNAARAMPAYTLSDRGTWLSFADKGPLGIRVAGDPALVNRYDVIELDPARHGAAHLAEAHALAAWLAGPEAQALIGAYTIGGEALFHPSAAAPR